MYEGILSSIYIVLGSLFIKGGGGGRMGQQWGVKFLHTTCIRNMNEKSLKEFFSKIKWIIRNAVIVWEHH